jgi:5-methylthioadenosine/S-adenosylhomocysteine deaminase
LPDAEAERASGDPPGTPPLAATPDMPGGPQQAAGPPPPGRTVTIPPIQPLAHDRKWLASIKGRGFHNGALDDLVRFYR